MESVQKEDGQIDGYQEYDIVYKLTHATVWYKIGGERYDNTVTIFADKGIYSNPLRTTIIYR